MKRDFSTFPPIGIISYSDFYDVPDPKVWGDYWFKENLIKEFKKLGYPVDNSKPKILLHLFGEPLRRLSSNAYNILWIHSHPDRIKPEILRKYRKIYCISTHFTKKINGMGFNAEPLMIPTNMTPVKENKIYEIIFVGNTKNNKMRKIIGDMREVPYDIKIWGWGWKGLVPDRWYGGDYYENNELNKLYASSKIVLNDHHEDMRREGFINPRVLDVLASGGFVISDRVLGMDELLDSSVAEYSTPDELRALIDKYINDDEGRDSLSRRGQRIALRYTYKSSCEKIIRHIESISGKLFL